MRRNLGQRARLMRIIGGGMLAGYALARDGRPMVNDGLFILGVATAIEGLHGYCIFTDKLNQVWDRPMGFIGEGE